MLAGVLLFGGGAVEARDNCGGPIGTPSAKDGATDATRARAPHLAWGVLYRSGEQPATQPARHLILEGQVFDYIGSGVGGVTVRVFIPGDGGRKELTSTTTDPMGDFKVLHIEPVQGPLVVAFAKSGFKPHEVTVESVPGEPPPFVDHQFQGDLALKGEVRDHLKRGPVAGAKVVLAVAYSEWSAASDEAGRFMIESLSPCQGTLTIEAQGFARLAEHVAIAQKGQGAEAGSEPLITVRGGAETTPDGGILFILKPERIVHLRIADGEGTPISKVVVESVVKDTADFRSGATDADGTLVLRGLSIDGRQVQLRLTHAGHVSSASFDRIIDLPPDQAQSTHTLTMASAATITGKVVSADGPGLGGARLAVGPSLDETVATAWSELDGAFTLNGVPAGQAVVTVHLAEYAPQLLVVAADPQSPASLEVVLSPAVQIAGRVLDPDGKPVGGAHVMAGEWRGYRTLALQAISGEDGRFAIADVPSDAFTVHVTARGFEPLMGRPVNGGATDLVFKFTAVRAEPPSPLAARLKPGTACPAFEATTLDGRKIKLADFAGKYLFLDFWATWCGPCVIEIPHVAALHQALGSRKDFEIVGISLDFDEQALRKFIKDNNVTWPQVFGESAGAARLADQFGAAAIPASYLVGPDGQIIAADLGGKGLTEQVRTHIEKPPPAAE